MVSRGRSASGTRRGCSCAGTARSARANRAPRTAEPSSLAADVLRTMNERKITQMFVVEAGKPVGLIHMHDLLKAGLA